MKFLLICLCCLTMFRGLTQADSVYYYSNDASTKSIVDSIFAIVQNENALLFDSNGIAISWNQLLAYYQSMDTITCQDPQWPLQDEHGVDIIVFNYLDSTPNYVMKFVEGDQYCHAFAFHWYSSLGEQIGPRILFYLKL